MSRWRAGPGHLTDRLQVSSLICSQKHKIWTCLALLQTCRAFHTFLNVMKECLCCCISVNLQAPWSKLKVCPLQMSTLLRFLIRYILYLSIMYLNSGILECKWHTAGILVMDKQAPLSHYKERKLIESHSFNFKKWIIIIITNLK